MSENNSKELYTCNAVITAAGISVVDGTLDVWMTFDYGDGFAQAFTLASLYISDDYTHYSTLSPAGFVLYRCMQLASVSKWSEMQGRTIRVRKEGKMGDIIGIGHIIKEDWLTPELDIAVQAVSQPKRFN